MDIFFLIELFIEDFPNSSWTIILYFNIMSSLLYWELLLSCNLYGMLLQ